MTRREDAAAEALLEQAARIGIHSAACRSGQAEAWGEGWSAGCVACDEDAARYARAEQEQERWAFELAFETNLEHREEMEREAAGCFSRLY